MNKSNELLVRGLERYSAVITNCEDMRDYRDVYLMNYRDARVTDLRGDLINYCVLGHDCWWFDLYLLIGVGDVSVGNATV